MLINGALGSRYGSCNTTISDITLMQYYINDIGIVYLVQPSELVGILGCNRLKNWL